MKDYIRGIIKAYSLSIVLIFILSICISTTSLKESIIRPAVIIISGFSILIASIFLANDKKEKGLINGAIIGVIYMFILYVISSFALWDFSVSQNSITMIFVGIVSGIIGGIIGVNFKK